MVPYQGNILKTAYDGLIYCPLLPCDRTSVRLINRFPDILFAVAEGLILSFSFMFYERKISTDCLSPLQSTLKRAEDVLP